MSTPVGATALTDAPDAPCVDIGLDVTGHVERWPEAESLFRHDAQWRGGDGSFALPLGNERTLWLFSDSFIANRPGERRAQSVLVSNSVAIQQGSDPEYATLQFNIPRHRGRPRAYFPDRGDRRFWPTRALRVDGAVLVLLIRLRPDPGGLGFHNEAGEARWIENPQDAPSHWRIHQLTLPPTPWHTVFGTGDLWQDGEFVYALANNEDDHGQRLLRWRLQSVRAKDLSQPQWWMGTSAGWQATDAIAGTPPSLFDAASGLSISTLPDGRYLEVQAQGFGQADLEFRIAASATGPWMAPTRLYSPVENRRPGYLVYSGYGVAWPDSSRWVFTYSSNRERFADLVSDEDSYYPHFLRWEAGCADSATLPH